MTYEEYKKLTFNELTKCMQAVADWSQMEKGRNPFKTVEDKVKERDDLIEYARSINMVGDNKGGD